MLPGLQATGHGRMTQGTHRPPVRVLLRYWANSLPRPIFCLTVKEHPKLSRAGILLLVAGFALGRLVDVGRRRRPEGPRAEAVSPGQEAPPVTGSAPYSQDEPRRKWTAIASNPLVVALISAAVAGIVPFLVAGYQNQVARSQAVSAQPTQEVVQMEQSAGATFEDLQSVATYALKCSLQGG